MILISSSSVVSVPLSIFSISLSMAAYTSLAKCGRKEHASPTAIPLVAPHKIPGHSPGRTLASYSVSS